MGEYIDEHNGVRYCELIIIGRRVHMSQTGPPSEARKNGYFFDMIANAIKRRLPSKWRIAVFLIYFIFIMFHL